MTTAPGTAMDHFLGRERVDGNFKNWRSGLQQRMLESISGGC